MNFQNDDLFYDTPFVALHLDIMERNIKLLAEMSREANV